MTTSPSGGDSLIAASDALEFALDLWLGPDEETEEERAARLDAARDILAYDPELFDRTARLVADALMAAAASTVTPPVPRCLVGVVAADIAGLARIALAKFRALQRGVDLMRAAGALLIVAGLVAAGGAL